VKLTRTNGRAIGVGARLDALARLVDEAEDRLPEEALSPAGEVLRRAADRFGLSAEHTAAVIAGATGVGKSSLFNALVGIGLSPVAVRRPTTTQAIACVWEAERLAEARPLLDRLGVAERRQLTRDSALDHTKVRDSLAGLVLVDLPDYDSAIHEDQTEVDTAVELADVVIWVTDPQKYADAVWHERYLKQLAHHAEVMVIVLNQIDRLPSESVGECVGDLTRLVENDGLVGVPIFPVSVRSGQGIEELRRELTSRVSGRRAAADRLAADVDWVAEQLGPYLLPSEDKASLADASDHELPESIRTEVLDGLRSAAGVSSLADVVSVRMAAHAAAAVASPLRQFGAALGRESSGTSTGGPAGAGSGPGHRSLKELLQLATEPLDQVPAPVPVDRAALETVLGRLAEASLAGLPADWSRTARRQLLDRRTDLAQQIDMALAECEFDAERADRRLAIRMIHILCLIMVVGGVAMLFIRSIPVWGGPALSLLGLVGTGVIDLIARSTARRAARAGGQVAVGQLSAELAAVAQDILFGPVAAELAGYRRALTDFRTVQGY
jgi:GTPase Era involved in 16S rRNA processing